MTFELAQTGADAAGRGFPRWDSSRHADREKFLDKIEIGDHPQGCWVWRGSLAKSGYGTVTRGAGKKGVTKTFLAHRISWELSNGRPIPDGLMVLHACDNRRCVRPSHLRTGTAKANVEDMIERNRGGWLARYGERHPNHKLSDAAVAEIRSAPLARGALAALARKHGVSPTTVGRVAAGKTRLFGSALVHISQATKSVNRG